MKILRCTQLSEEPFLDKRDEAYIIGTEEVVIPEGYGAYLYTEEQADHCKGKKDAYLLPHNCEIGSFIEIVEEEGKAKLCWCDDIPDRTLFLTAQCNSNCVMCPYTENYRLKAGMEPIEKIERYISLMSNRADYLCITGGEPTLQKDGFLRVLQLIKSRFDDVIVHILTNGRTFSYIDFVDAFRAVRPYKTVLGIPLHASSAELHDRISQAKGSFRQTTVGIRNLLCRKELVEIRIVTSKLNYQDLPNLAKLIATEFQQVHHVCFMGLEMMGNAFLNKDEVWSPYEEVWPYVRTATDILIHHGIQVELYNYPLCHIEKKYWAIYKKSITPSKVKYLDSCDACQMKHECGGFFETTIHTPGISVFPIQEA